MCVSDDIRLTFSSPDELQGLYGRRLCRMTANVNHNLRRVPKTDLNKEFKEKERATGYFPAPAFLKTYQIQFNLPVVVFARPNIERCRCNLIDQWNRKSESRQIHTFNVMFAGIT